MIGYNILDRMTYEREYSTAEKAELWRHIEVINPAPLLFMDNTDWLKTALDKYPDRRIAFRRWSRNDNTFHLNKSVDDIWGFYRKYDNRAWIQVLNEPHGYDTDSLKALNYIIPPLVKKFSSAGKKGIFINFSVGNPDDKRYDLIKDAFRSIIEYGQSLGLHEYGTYRGMLWNGGNHQSDVFPYRVARFEFINDYCRTNFNAIPDIDITEWGIDSSQYKGDDNSKKGYKDAPLAGSEYFMQLVDSWYKVYKNRNVKALYLAYYGNTGKKNTADDWYSMDVSHDSEYKREVEKFYGNQPEPDKPTLASILDKINDLKNDIIRFAS